MSDWKSKLPSLQEVASMTTKLAKDIKNSVCEIIEDYKQKHPNTPAEPAAKAPETKAEVKAAAPKAEEKVEPKAEVKTEKEPKS